MIPAIKRNTSTGGLMTYLVGPGEDNEHLRPHLVAGSPDIMFRHNGVVLDHAAALDISASLESMHRLTGKSVAGGHVWHCALSLAVRRGAPWALREAW